jgi:hypothetical protein
MSRGVQAVLARVLLVEGQLGVAREVEGACVGFPGGLSGIIGLRRSHSGSHLSPPGVSMTSLETQIARDGPVCVGLGQMDDGDLLSALSQAFRTSGRVVRCMSVKVHPVSPGGSEVFKIV